jgi:hypothetical protein
MEDGWFATPNLNGRSPAKEPPKDRPIIVRNLQNRRDGEGARRFVSEHLAWWDGTQFVRLTDDLFRDTVFVFFHIWREWNPE